MNFIDLKINKKLPEGTPFDKKIELQVAIAANTNSLQSDGLIITLSTNSLIVLLILLNNIFCGATIPNNSILSCVIVPVLSKQMTSNRPACEILYGSVQKINCCDNAANDCVTANDNSIGNSGGITDVIIIIQCNAKRNLLRFSSCNPPYNTIIEAITANITNKPIK